MTIYSPPRTVEKDFDQEAGEAFDWLVGGDTTCECCGDEDGENYLTAFRSTESDGWWVVLTYRTESYFVDSEDSEMQRLTNWSQLVGTLSKCPDWSQENMDELLVFLERK